MRWYGEIVGGRGAGGHCDTDGRGRRRSRTGQRRALRHLRPILHRTATDAALILRRDGLNPAQFHLLRALAESPVVTQAQVVAQRGVTAGSVAQLVTKMTEVGLVRREPDGAANRLWLTDEGRALVARLAPDQDAFFARRFAGLEPAHLLRLRDLAVRTLAQLPDQS